ncbi:glycoside hydrolase family 55 protein [Acidobacterium sp. S8]|uniref:glycoside hydrolase family 55 protein n=1 Tax=Acidobacterium sp. S8 TaxID=1641854 RepID=UPI001C205F94|nr:glycoside hydrolase family 55 protein [Acidobacterium sp. S8]
MNSHNEAETILQGEKVTSRRRLLSLGAAAGMATFLEMPGSAHAEGKTEGVVPFAVDVRNHGARGDASTDDTAAFQHALDTVYKAGGGTVYAPPGRYLFRAELNIPDGVTLRGSFTCVPSHNGLRDKGQPKPGDDGTALFVDAGRGSEDGKPFLLNTNSSIC